MIKTRVSVVKVKEIPRSVRESIELLGGLESFIPHNSKVLIKPSLCGGSAKKPGSFTNMEVIKSAVELISTRTGNIAIGESDGTACSADKLFLETGLKDFAEAANVKLVNLSFDDRVDIAVPDSLSGIERIEMPRTLVESEVLVSIPVLKTHILTTMTGALKNTFGLIPEKRKIIYHSKGLNKILADLNRIIDKKIKLIIVDGTISMEGDGPLKGNPVQLNVLIAGCDPVAVDSVACKVIGFDPASIDHIVLASKTGLGTLNLDEIHLFGDDLEGLMRAFKKPSMVKAKYISSELISKMNLGLANRVWHKSRGDL